MNSDEHSDAFRKLRDFMNEDMQLSHIYQPVMLRTLLKNEGSATREDIARAFLNEDRSQLDYYKEIVGKDPQRVLSKHGMVQRDGKTYRLADNLQLLSPAERDEL